MERRAFLKGSMVAAGALVIGSAIRTEAATKFPAGLVYTRENPGRWVNIVKTHAPIVTMEGGKVKIVTPHPMTLPHYIVKHELLSEDGMVIGEKTFAYTDPAAESFYVLPGGFHGTLWATSFCNLHDLWLAEFKV